MIEETFAPDRHPTPHRGGTHEALQTEIAARQHAEQALRQSEERQRFLLAAARAGIWEWDLRTGAVTLSDNLASLHGLPPRGSAATYQHFLGQVHPDDRERVAQTVAGSLEDRSDFHTEFRTTWPDGTVHWLESRGRFVCDDAGQPARMLGVDLIVTERKQAEIALQTSEARYRRVVEAAHEGIWTLDSQSRTEYVNERMAEMLGYTVAEMLGRPAFDFMDEQDRPAAQRGLQRRRNGVSEQYELRFRRKDGRELWTALAATPLLGERGEYLGALAKLTDITERRQMEQARRQQQELLQTVFDHIPLMVIVFDAAGRTQMLNKQWERVLGWTSEEARQTNLLAECYPDARDRQRAREQIQTADPAWSDYRTRARDGRVFDTTWTNVRLSDGTLIGIGQDVTERRRLEAQLQQAQRMEALGRLAGGVAHDFNNMLGAITGYAGLLLHHRSLDEEIRSVLKEILKAGEHAANISRQLLAFSRHSARSPEVVDLNEVVAGMYRMLRLLIEEDIDLVIDCDATSTPVLADVGQIEQVLLNLAINARDAIPDGGKICIETRNAVRQPRADLPATFPPAAYVRLCVTDTGCGMAPETQACIFEPFFTTKEQANGTGLGLSTVFGIVQQSGGHLEVDSQVGVGTTFRIFLPRSAAAVHAESGPAAAAVPAGTETVLLAEDEPIVRSAVASMLREQGYTVLEALQGQDALRLCEEYAHRIDLLLTDVRMPGMSGPELIERAAGLRPDMRVLLMSGYIDDTVARLGLADRGLDFIQKPFSVADFAQKVRQVLAREPEAKTRSHSGGPARMRSATP